METEVLFFSFPTHAGGHDVTLGEKNRVDLFDRDDVLVKGRLCAEVLSPQSGCVVLRGNRRCRRAYWYS